MVSWTSTNFQQRIFCIILQGGLNCNDEAISWLHVCFCLEFGKLYYQACPVQSLLGVSEQICSVMGNVYVSLSGFRSDANWTYFCGLKVLMRKVSNTKAFDDLSVLCAESKLKVCSREVGITCVYYTKVNV